jgi:hypothetical protein
MEDIYFKKYLKYKAKYAQLKQMGGVTLVHGDHIYFIPTSAANSLCPKGVGKTSPSNNNINNILEKAGIVYRGKLGERKLTLVETNTTKAKRIAYEASVAAKEATIKGVKATGSAIASGARATGSAIASGAKIAGEAALVGTVLAGQAVASGARATGSAIASGARATGSAISSGARATGSAIASGARASSRSLGRGLSSLGQRLQGDSNQPQEPNEEPIEQPQVGGGLVKNINELLAGDVPVEITLDQPLSYQNAREVMGKLKVVNPQIASMVTIDLKRIGSNICQRVE